MTEAVKTQALTIELGEHRALDEVTLVIPAGARCAIIGPNGGGKTTLLRALLGLIRPTSGHVEVLGLQPGALPFGDIGYIPQLKTLDRTFPARVEELVSTGLTGRWPWRMSASMRARCAEALERVGAAHLARRQVRALSGGELQRVFLARALIRRPRLILLDEPATGMDSRGETDMYRLIEQYRSEAECTVLMITHDWGAAQYHATHVLVIDRRVVGFGTPEATLTDLVLRSAFGHIGHAHSMAISTAPPSSPQLPSLAPPPVTPEGSHTACCSGHTHSQTHPPSPRSQAPTS